MIQKKSLEYAKLFLKFYCDGTNIKKEVFYFQSDEGFEVIDTRSDSIFMNCFDCEVSAMCYDENKYSLEHIIQELQELYKKRQ